MESTRRSLLIGGAMMMAAARMVAGERKPALRIQRLSWAGLRIEASASSLFIDPWTSVNIWDGSWNRSVVPLEASADRRAVLITHLHNDHFDPAAIQRLIGNTGSVICVERMSTAVASRGLRVRAVPLYQPESWGELVVIPVEAVDGFGDTQVSWIVIGEGQRIIHCGDTMWHGRFDLIGRAYGPFDVAFVPINGAMVTRDSVAANVPRTMQPAHAVVAAAQLRARLLVPIHYGHSDAEYHESANALQVLQEQAKAMQVPVRIIGEGEWL